MLWKQYLVRKRPYMGYLINKKKKKKTTPLPSSSPYPNQQEVGANEKRQRVDNNPYGHESWVHR